MSKHMCGFIEAIDTLYQCDVLISLGIDTDSNQFIFLYETFDDHGIDKWENYVNPCCVNNMMSVIACNKNISKCDSCKFNDDGYTTRYEFSRILTSDDGYDFNLSIDQILDESYEFTNVASFNFSSEKFANIITDIRKTYLN